MEKPRLVQVSDNPKTLGEHIRKVRIDRGLTQQDLVMLFKTSKDLITCWENGRRHPRIYWYPKILSFLGYNLFNHRLDSNSGCLRHVRLCNGYSMKLFARILAVDVATVARWESDKGKITPSVIQIIENHWNKLPDYLKKSADGSTVTIWELRNHKSSETLALKIDTLSR